MSTSTGNLDSLIRKLRKKLRQIENLEILHRSLTQDEIIKARNYNAFVNSKDDIREMLQDALEEQLEKEEQVTEKSSRQYKKSRNEISRGAGDEKSSFTNDEESDQG
ncbi:unnamed protein product, partial [Candidula unifasciata]